VGGVDDVGGGVGGGGCFFFFFWLRVSKFLCSFFFWAVADCEGFWSKEDGGLRDFLVLSVAGSGSGSGLHW